MTAGTCSYGTGVALAGAKFEINFRKEYMGWVFQEWKNVHRLYYHVNMKETVNSKNGHNFNHIVF